MATLAVQPGYPVSFDDEMMALALQLEEINCQPTVQKGKYKAGNPPDMELAFSIIHEEVQIHIQFLNDLKIAHSMARAVDTDAQAIAESVQDEGGEERDRRLALQLSGQNPDDVPPPYAEVGVVTSVQGDEVSGKLLNAETVTDTQICSASLSFMLNCNWRHSDSRFLPFWRTIRWEKLTRLLKHTNMLSRRVLRVPQPRTLIVSPQLLRSFRSLQQNALPAKRTFALNRSQPCRANISIVSPV